MLRAKKFWSHCKAVIVLAVLYTLFCLPWAVGITADGTAYSYRRGEACVERLVSDSKKRKYRHNWLACINRFKAVYRASPDGPKADDSLFMIARLYANLYGYSNKQQDLVEARDYYKRLLKRFPKSPLKERARTRLAALEISEKPTKRKSRKKSVVVKRGISKDRPKAVDTDSGEERSGRASAGGFAAVNNLRFWSSPYYTRVVIDVDDEVQYSYRLLKKDPSIGKPQRLYVDLEKTRMGSNIKSSVPIGDDLLSDARAAQYSKDTTRVVVDIKSIDNYEIFSLKNPFRVVIDVHGHAKKKTSKTIPTAASKTKKKSMEPVVPAGPLPKGALARQLALGVRRIVIDPGHGGKDPGAIGYKKRVLEKNVTLEVARRLSKKVRHRLGLETILTRSKDVFLSLEERTAIANTKNGDIFVSIHANANRNRKMRGIETYFLNFATDEETIMVAARENATSEKNISDLEPILDKLMKNAKIDESSTLAGYVQDAMAGELQKKYGNIRDHGVKQAPFYVLLGAKMPSILVELSFISNPTECMRLNTAAYQDALADALVVGIEKYIQAIRPVTFHPSTDHLRASK